MKNYTCKLLKKFSHKLANKPYISLHKCKPINYDAKAQYTDDPDTNPPLKELVIRRAQKFSEPSSI